MTNLLGYMKCERNHKEKVKAVLYDKAKSNLTPDQLAKIGTFALK